MLTVSICKQCRINVYGDDAWNEFAEAWANLDYPKRMQEPHIICPADLVLAWTEKHFEWQRIYDKFEQKLLDLGSHKSDFEFTCFRDRLRTIFWDVIDVRTKQFWQTADPPLWCPYIDEHKIKGTK